MAISSKSSCRLIAVMEPTLFERVERQAAREDRSLSNLARLALKQYLEQEQEPARSPRAFGKDRGDRR